MKWNIITDSSSDLNDFVISNGDIRFTTVPFVFNVGDKNIVDDSNLETNEFLKEIKDCKEKSARLALRLMIGTKKRIVKVIAF